jgi:hypothetical protein
LDGVPLVGYIGAMIDRSRCTWLACCLASVCCVSACARVGPGALTIATSWPESEQAALEADFRSWVQSSRSAVGAATTIAWVRLLPGEDLIRVARRDPRIDVLVGGPTSAYHRLGDSGRLAAMEQPGLPFWCEARRSPVGMAVNEAVLKVIADEVPPAGLALSGPALRDQLAWDDPRRDPVSLEFARRRLDAGDWAEGYAELVRTAGNARSIGWRPGSALASLERGDAAAAPTAVARATESSMISVRQLPRAPDWVEGAAVLRGAPHTEAAQAFLQFLGQRDEVGKADAPRGDAKADGLLADLLGATLVDAQDELRAARLALAKVDGTKRAGKEAWLTKAPPWPPASVEKLGAEADSGPWMETLAGQVAPDPAVRAWLLESWQRSPRPIDGRLLDELANAAGGRLVEEPRFRAWLRAEWTAWARQRYQAAARVSEASPS